MSQCVGIGRPECLESATLGRSRNHASWHDTDLSGSLASTRYCAIGVSTSLAYDARVIFVETPISTRQMKELVDDEVYRSLQLRLVANPDEGDLIPRSGGLRKVRLGLPGRGKRGGARVIYYWITAKSQIYMLLAYAKNVQEDLTEEQLRILRALVRQEFD